MADPIGDLIEDKLPQPELPAGPVPLPPPPGTVGEDRPAYDPRINLWERIRRGFAMPELQGPRVTAATRWYASRPDYIDRMSARAGLYLFHIVEEIEKRDMPTELALLPFVESAMQPEAVSHAKAAGLWQFIPSTGKIYALEQNLWKDERRDVIHSTRAALDYLQKLYGDFGDWHLALAAYNMGEGGLGRAIARNRRARKPTDYASLRIPLETQGYVPKLQAIKNIVADPARFGIELANIPNQPYFVAIPKTRDIDVATAARLAEMPMGEFRALNPAYNRPIILGTLQPNILLPSDKAELFTANLAAYEATGQALTNWTGYTMKPNETLAQVATRVGVSEAQLREANRVPPRYRLASGSTILIPRDETMDEDIPAAMVDASFALVPEQSNLRQMTYRVRRGDTLDSVAARWRVDPADVVAWNNLRSNTLFAGQRLSLTVARAPAKPTATRAATTKGKPSSTAKKSPPSRTSTVRAAEASTRSVAPAGVR
ncbi:MAG: transglycosylase SLT domain-containing protein [Betaproteobacteria bacterium]|jgi:membrane-bound lytic murein transglycosylase D